MKLARLTAVVAASASLALSAASVAAADPVNAPGAVSVTYVCGGVPVTLTLAPGNGGVGFTSSTRVGVAVGATVTNISTGQVLFERMTPGFEVNPLQTTTCTATFGDLRVDVTVLFTPATT